MNELLIESTSTIGILVGTFNENVDAKQIRVAVNHDEQVLVWLVIWPATTTNREHEHEASGQA